MNIHVFIHIIWNVLFKEITSKHNNIQSSSYEANSDMRIHLLDSAAVKSVCEMGYSKEQVVGPLQILKDSGQGKHYF